MTIISVQEHNSTLVVDSRLIAERLGIEHRAFIQTLKKHQGKIEQRFGVITFEMSKPSEGSCGGRPEKYALLTEPQATTLMTFSKNTEQVVECKLDLVQAFEEAKQVVKTVIPHQSERIRELELQLAIAQAQNSTVLAQERLMLRSESIVTMHGVSMLAMIQGRPNAVVIEKEVVKETVMVDENLNPVATFDGIGITEIAKRLGFTGKNANQQCKKWLQSVGIKDEDWRQEMTAHASAKLPREILPKLKQMWAQRKGNRQMLIGE